MIRLPGGRQKPAHLCIQSRGVAKTLQKWPFCGILSWREGYKCSVLGEKNPLLLIWVEKSVFERRNLKLLTYGPAGSSNLACGIQGFLTEMRAVFVFGAPGILENHLQYRANGLGIEVQSLLF